MWLKCSVFAFLFLFIGCVSNNKSDNNISTKNIALSGAKQFSMTATGEGFILNVFNPWQKAENVTYTYVLQKSAGKPNIKGDTTIITFPVRKIICLSTTHVAFLNAINQSETIRGISGTKYVYDQDIRNRIQKNDIVEVGYEEQLNYELILALEPDVVFAYGINTQSLGYYQKMQELGIPVVFVAEYLEESPLGKSEWIKFFGAFYDQLELAQDRYDTIKSEYNRLASFVDTVSDKPTILTGLPFQGTWYVTGGQTNLANMIQHASGIYLWNDLTGADVYPMELENVFVRNKAADLWIHPGTANSMNDILSVDERMASFEAFRKGQIYNNNARQSPNGGNDYFESGVVQPHTILEDLIHIFHPDILPHHHLYYYQKLQ